MVASFSPKNLRNFFPCIVLLPNETRYMYYDFGCLECDLNLAVFSMVIFLSTSKRPLLARFITSEEAFNLAKVAIFALSK